MNDISTLLSWAGIFYCRRAFGNEKLLLLDLSSINHPVLTKNIT